MNRYLSAELLRARHTALVWLPLAAIPLVALTYNLAIVVNPDADAASILMWQAIYLTGFAAPLAALFAATAEQREKKANYGGTLWLVLDRKRERAARLTIVLVSLAAFHILNFGGTGLLLTLGGRSDMNRVFFLGFCAFVGTIGVAGLATALARLTNLLTTLVVFTAWQIIGITRPVVEGDMWWAYPMAWPVRLVLPILGVHQNSVPLEPGSALSRENPVFPLLLCTLLAFIGIISATVAPEKWNTKNRRIGLSAFAAPRPAPQPTAPSSAQFTPPSAPHYEPAVASRSATLRPRPYRALTLAALTPAVKACFALTAAAFLLTTLIYPRSYVHGLFAFAVLPLGAGLLPTLVWPALERAWAVMRVEYRPTARSMLLWNGACVLIVAAFATACGLAGGGNVVDETRRFLIGTLVGYALVLVMVQLQQRLGTSAAIIAVMIVTVFSATLGGDILADTNLWSLAISAWPNTATTLPRFGIAVITCGVIIAILQRPTERLLNTKR